MGSVLFPLVLAFFFISTYEARILLFINYNRVLDTPLDTIHMVYSSIRVGYVLELGLTDLQLHLPSPEKAVESPDVAPLPVPTNCLSK